MLLDDGKETLGVTALDAEPDAIIVMPGDSLLPVTLAIGMAVVFGAMLTMNWWALGVGVVLSDGDAADLADAEYAGPQEKVAPHG